MGTELLVNILNYTAIICGFIGKLPQIQVLYKNKSPAGLSVKSTVMELFAFLILMSYCAKRRYNLSSYFEVVCGVVQTVIFLVMLLHYDGSLTVYTLSSIVALLSLFYSLYLGFPHDSILNYMIAGVSLVLAFSKTLQIRELLATKNSNNVSITRWLIFSYLSFARILTQILGTVDVALMFNASLAFCLNVTIVILSLRFRQVKVKTGKKD